MTIASLSFTSQNEIGKCYISFNTSTNLVQTEPARLPTTFKKIRTVKTDRGDVGISCIDGYRILYNNHKKVSFVNLKIELSEVNSYNTDKKNLIENLKFLNSHTTGMETKDLIELEFNGYKVYGVSRGTIETGSILGSFVMFPENGVTVYFDFQNQKPGFRNFESLEDYKKQRNEFINAYTKYLTVCNNR